MCRRGLALAVALLVALAATPARAEVSPPRFEQAIAAYEAGRFAIAAGLLEEEALAGNLRACEILGQMHLFGESLFGPGFNEDLPRARRWLAPAAAAGSPVARLLLAHVEARLARKKR